MKTLKLLLLIMVGAHGSFPAVAAGQDRTGGDSLEMEFVRIEPGSMIVGRFQPVCPPSAVPTEGADPRTHWSAEDHRRCEEMVRRQASPGFQVTIERPFQIGRFEVTQAEWARVMRDNPSHFQGMRVDGNSDQHPVENVTWEQVQEFIARLNALDTTAVYRLPTEFEWEYAARAGADREPSWREIRERAWIAQVDGGTTQPVGRKAPNEWGLHDMLGNVWEWVHDYYNGEIFPDPVPPSHGAVHVLRGGSFLSDVKNATYFTHAGGPGNGWDVGFRLVREELP